MSENARKIAERVARKVAGGSQPSSNAAVNLSAELSSVRESLNQLQDKLVQIEALVTNDRSGGTSYSSNQRPVPITHSPWLAGVNAGMSHPSQERFGVEEAAISELVDFFEKEKTCSVEPGGKPCDHCAMCSSRGF